jgi:hypothetical protein
MCSGWATAGELIKAVAPVFTAGAACAGAYIAYQGLTKWRAEAIGKRKVELAEEVLANFYEAREIILAARMPGSLGNEGDTRQKGPNETEADTRTLNAYFTVAERLSKKTEFFAQLEARRYRFITHFGAEAAEPYMVLRKIHGEILLGVRMLLMTHHQRELGAAVASIQHWRTVIWETSEDDQIRERLNTMVESVEKVCRPAIQEAAR